MRAFYRLTATLVLCLPIVGALPIAQALAAPQVLAVLATDGGVPFRCTSGQCRADLSTYCLQRNRPVPSFGTLYTPAAPGVFTLVVTERDGTERRLPAGEHVVFVEMRGFMAVSANLTERTLAGLDAVGARIVVGSHAALVPVPVPGDPNPLSAREIALATGPSRSLGQRIVDTSAEAGAARILGAAVNALPASGGDHGQSLDALIGAGPDAGERPGLIRALAEFSLCRDALAGGGSQLRPSLRRCLEFRHDELMRALTIDYWNASVGS